MLRYLKGYLIPGTTGDGWELDDGETAELVRFSAAEARKKEGPMLHAGVRIPADTVCAAGDILTHLDLVPRKGYLQ